VSEADERIIGCHLGFRRRTVNALIRGRSWDYDPRTGFTVVDGRHSVTTLPQLAACTIRDVLRIGGFGRVSLTDCEKVLRARGFTATDSQLLRLLEKERAAIPAQEDNLP
jgi:hypothetical protein